VDFVTALSPELARMAKPSIDNLRLVKRGEYLIDFSLQVPVSF
jgi:hypothetical protein